MSAALASLVLGLCVAQGGPAPVDSAQLELETRRLALAGSCAELAELVAGAADGPRAAARLDAVRRGLTVGTLSRESADGHARLVAAVQARLADEHPDVHVAALEALAALGVAPGGGASRDALARVRSEQQPRARLAWVHCLAGQPGTAPALLALAADTDQAVARAARSALIAHPERTEEHAEALCRALVGKSDEDGLLELALALERCGATPRLLIRLAGVCEAGFGGDARMQRSFAALFHAVTLRLHKFVAPHGLAFPHVIVGGWLGHDARSAADPRRRALLLRAARLGGPGLAEGFVHSAAAATTAAERAAYLEGAVESLDPQSLTNGALALADLGAETRLELWRRVDGRARRWSFDETRAWLATSDPEVRVAAVAAIATTFLMSRDPDSGRLLELALDDDEPRVALTAFRALCAGADEQRLALLHSAWSARPADERLGAWLEALPRGAPLAPFRDELLATGAERARRGLVAELLAGFPGDTAVADTLRAWIDEELARLRSSAAAPEGVPIALACLRALVRVDAGRAALPALLHESVPPRLRVEAALALQGGDDAVAWITRDYASCDGELRARCLRALGTARGAGALDFLLRLVGDDGEHVRDPGLAQGEVLTAVKALAQRARAGDGTPAADAPRVEAVLLRLARDGWSPAVRQAALETLLGLPATPRSVLEQLEGHPEELDPRLALAFGECALAAGDKPELAARLLRAAWIGLLGEPEREDSAALALGARAQLLDLAETRQEWGTAATLAENLCADWRCGALDERAFAAAFGDFDPRLGADGPARVAAAALQARAHAALDAGEMERAQELSQSARASLGFSRWALDAQDALERRLAR